MEKPDQPWKLEFADYQKFKRGLEKLPVSTQIIVSVAIEELLVVHGLALAAEPWLKALTKGLWEFRIGPSTSAVYSRAGIAVPEDHQHSKLLVRLFVAFEGDRVIVALGIYDKGSNDSLTHQNRQIEDARKALRSWKLANK